MHISIETVFPLSEQLNNIWLKKAFEIINMRKIQQLKYIAHIKDRPNNYILCHRHHIIPQSVFTFYKEKINNTKQNMITLSIKEHILVHYYYMKYFQSLNISQFNTYMIYINSLMVKSNLHCKCIDSFSEQQIQQLSNEASKLYKTEASKLIKLRWQDPIWKKQQLAKMKAGYTEQSYKKRKESLAQAMLSESYKQKISIASRTRWKDPEYKKRTITKRKEFYQKNPEKLIEKGKHISQALHKDKNILINRNKKTGAAIKKAWLLFSTQKKQDIKNRQIYKMVRYKYIVFDLNNKYITECLFLTDLILFFKLKNKDVKQSALKECIRRYQVHETKNVYGYYIKRQKYRLSEIMTFDEFLNLKK